MFFANFAEALAEGRGKAYADALKEMRVYVNARLLTDKGTEEIVSISELRKGDKVLCEAGDIIPLDGEVIEGIASVPLPGNPLRSSVRAGGTAAL